MPNHEEENTELEELEALTESDEESEIETGDANKITFSEPAKRSQSIFELIYNTMNYPLFFFNVGYRAEVEQSGLSRTSFGTQYIPNLENYVSINTLVNDGLYSGFLSDELKQKYIEILDNPTEDVKEELETFIRDVGNYLNKGQKTQVRPQPGPLDIGGKKVTDVVIQYDRRKTRKGTPQLDGGTTINYLDVAEDIATTNFERVIAEGEAAEQAIAGQEAASQAQDVVVNQGIVRTSSPAWGYSSDSEGYVTVINADGQKERKLAPFFKGSEYGLFNTLDPSDIVRLQQQMVRAGMDAPPIDQYGVWTDREANFMTAVFIKATDSGDAFKDADAGLPAYTTTLNKFAENYSANEAFINLLSKANYANPAATANVAPATIHAMLETAAAANDTELSAKDLVDYAYVVINALEQEKASIAAFNDSLVSDRDIILGATFKDPRGIKEGEFGRFFKGNDLPLVLPSVEFLTQQKGGPVGQPINAQEIVNAQLADLQANQISGNLILDDIKYIANIFESSMGAIGYDL
jgi:hypothetical protein